MEDLKKGNPPNPEEVEEAEQMNLNKDLFIEIKTTLLKSVIELINKTVTDENEKDALINSINNIINA